MQNGDNHVMAHHFVMPWTQIRAHTVRGNLVPGHFYVPIDDENCMVWNWVYSFTDEPLSEWTLWYEDNASGNGPAHVDQTTFRSYPNRENNWGLDRDAQRTVSYSGVKGINAGAGSGWAHRRPQPREPRPIGPADHRRPQEADGRSHAGIRRSRPCRGQYQLL